MVAINDASNKEHRDEGGGSNRRSKGSMNGRSLPPLPPLPSSSFPKGGTSSSASSTSSLSAKLGMNGRTHAGEERGGGGREGGVGKGEGSNRKRPLYLLGGGGGLSPTYPSSQISQQALMSEPHVNRHLSEQAGAGVTQRLQMKILQATDDLFIDQQMAKATFMIPCTECECVAPIDCVVQQAIEELGLPGIAPPWLPGSGLVHEPTRLLAMDTDGDGDCLLHAVSLALYGAHDRQALLRGLIVQWLVDEQTAAFLKVAFEQGEKKEDAGMGLERSSEQLTTEWEEVIVSAAVSPHNYLARFHIFILAHVLKRTIIVYADRYIRDEKGQIYAPCQMAGIYLPTQINETERIKYPVVIAYTVTNIGCQGHFTALVGVEDQARSIPLTDEEGVLLPIPYSGVNHEDRRQALRYLQDFLYIEQRERTYVVSKKKSSSKAEKGTAKGQQQQEGAVTGDDLKGGEGGGQVMMMDQEEEEEGVDKGEPRIKYLVNAIFAKMPGRAKIVTPETRVLRENLLRNAAVRHEHYARQRLMKAQKIRDLLTEETRLRLEMQRLRGIGDMNVYGDEEEDEDEDMEMIEEDDNNAINGGGDFVPYPSSSATTASHGSTYQGASFPITTSNDKGQGLEGQRLPPSYPCTTASTSMKTRPSFEDLFYNSQEEEQEDPFVAGLSNTTSDIGGGDRGMIVNPTSSLPPALDNTSRTTSPPPPPSPTTQSFLRLFSFASS